MPASLHVLTIAIKADIALAPKRGPMMNTRHLTEAGWKSIREKHAAMTPDQRRAWLRTIMGPERRQILGVEYEHLTTVFALTTPDISYNNQHIWTDEYQICGKKYTVTSGIEDRPIIEEIIDDIQQK